MRHVSVIRWIARVVGTMVVLVFGVLFLEDAFPVFLFGSDPVHMTALLTMLAGLLVVWRWEAVGSAMVLGGYLVDLVFVNMRMHTLSLEMGPLVSLMPLLGLAFGYVAWRSRATYPNDPE